MTVDTDPWLSWLYHSPHCPFSGLNPVNIFILEWEDEYAIRVKVVHYHPCEKGCYTEWRYVYIK